MGTYEKDLVTPVLVKKIPLINAYFWINVAHRERKKREKEKKT